MRHQIRFFLWASLVFGLFLHPALLTAQPVRGVTGDLWADRILGQSDDGTPNYGFGEINSNQAAATGLFNSYSVVVDNNPGHNMLYVYDSGNNRVLGVTMIGGQVTDGQGAALVLGQPDFKRTACNGDSNFQNYPNPPIPNSSCLCTLRYDQQSPGEAGSTGNMAVDNQGNLYVPDYWNNRVLRYDWPTYTGEPASAVWGQPDFGGYQFNNIGGNVTGAPSASNLGFVGGNCNQYAAGAGTDSWGNLWVADGSNNRVLRFPAPSPGGADPGVPLATADVVLGQSNFTSNTAGNGTSLTNLYQPLAVRVDSEGDVFVADGKPAGCPLNGRVLVFKPTGYDGTTGQPIYGTNMTATASFQFAQTYENRPVGLEWDPPTGGLWVTDFTASFGPNAGQSVLFLINVAGNSATAKKVILRDFPAYQGGPSSSSFTADIAPGYFTDAAGSQAPNWTFPDPRGSVGVDSQGNVYATDDRINDVWRFPNTLADPIPTIPPSPNGIVHSADVRIFHPRQFGLFNTRDSLTPSHLDQGHGVDVAAWAGVTQVIASEWCRLQFWDITSTGAAGLSNGQASSIAGATSSVDPQLELLPRIGRIHADQVGHLWAIRSIDGSPSQIEMYNLPLTPGATAALTLSGPFSVLGGGTISWTWLEGIAPAPDGSCLWLGNREGNRVFRVRDPLTSPVVDVILGQANRTSTTANRPSGIPSAANLNSPGAVRLDHHGYLYVSDHGLEDNGNYRMLRWNPNTLATAISQATTSGVVKCGVPADGVFGTNGSFTVAGCYPYNYSVPAPGICGPWEPAFNSDDSLMVVGQNSQGPGSRFPLVFSNPETGDTPVTQLKDFGPQTFAATFDNQDNLYMAELNRSRVLVYLQPFSSTTSTPTNTPTSTPTSSPTPTPTLTDSWTPTATLTGSATPTITDTETLTATDTPAATMNTDTPTATNSETPTPTQTPSPTATASFTSTPSPTRTFTETPTQTPTFTLSEGCKAPFLYPNPAKNLDSVMLHFSPCDGGGGGELKVYTVAFRLVKTQKIQQVPVGDLPLTLKDNWGNLLANGLYYVVVTTPRGRYVDKLVVLR